MKDIPIDLTTVGELSVRGWAVKIRPGSLTVGRPLFTMADDDGQPVEHWGTDHGPVYSYTTEDGRKMITPEHQVSRVIHNTQPPEPEEPEPKHELLPIGTRVLVSDWFRDRDGTIRLQNPQAGKIVGYDMHHSKYRWRYEFEPGHYSSTDQWAFVDNRVVVHPDGPQCPPDPREVRREPTGPVLYAVHVPTGETGRVVSTTDNPNMLLVEWLKPGTPRARVFTANLAFISESELERCPNGQLGDECGSGEDQCEACRQDEDAEGDEIEQSMGLRSGNPHSPGCPPVHHRH